MLLKAIFIAAVLSVCYGSIFESSLKFARQKQGGLHRMDIPESERKLQSLISEGKEPLLEKLRNGLLLRGQPMGGLSPNALLPLFGLKGPSEQADSNGQPPIMEGFTIQNCSEKAAEEAVFVINQLLVKPDPIVMPGTLTFEFNINLLDDIKQLTISLDLYKKIGSTEIRIPCLGQFGSCTYDVCTMLENVQSCPPELVKHNIPCKCPYSKGVYKEPGISAAIGAEVFAVGDYRVTANMTSGGKFAGCYKSTFTIRS